MKVFYTIIFMVLAVWNTACLFGDTIEQAEPIRMSLYMHTEDGEENNSISEEFRHLVQGCI